MTLILALANQKHAVLITDRRLTEKAKVRKEESNKAAVFGCRNARLAVAFTGLAAVGKFITRRWLLAALMESAAPDYLMGPTIEGFRERASRDFARIYLSRRDKLLTVVLAGYSYDDMPPRAYCWHVSNFEGMETNELPRAEASDEFSMEYCREQRPTSESPCLTLIAGEYRAVSERELARCGFCCGRINRHEPLWARESR